MNKIDIINGLAKEQKLNKNESEKIVNTIINEISKVLIVGGRAEFRGFGVFFSKTRTKRKVRNPKTGDTINIESRRLPQFKVAKHFFKKINE